MDGLEAEICRIGDDVVSCRRGCEGIVLSPGEGIIPRGLVLESRSTAEAGAVFLGMNPGQGDAHERRVFAKDGSFRATVAFMVEHRLLRNQYYVRLRQLAGACGLRGSILWTELAKCQSASDWPGSLPLETYRVCAAAFLRREVEQTPSAWPIFAVGRDAYGAAAFLFRDRSVVGVAHPTGSRGMWHAMFVNGLVKPSVAAVVTGLIGENRAGWVPDELLRRAG